MSPEPLETRIRNVARELADRIALGRGINVGNALALNILLEPVLMATAGEAFNEAASLCEREGAEAMELLIARQLRERAKDFE